MEGKSNQNDSSSSFVSELSGSKETHSSSSSSPSPNEVRDKAIKEKWDSILGTPGNIYIYIYTLLAYVFISFF